LPDVLPNAPATPLSEFLVDAHQGGYFFSGDAWTMKFTKPALSLPDLLAKLQARGLQVPDPAQALHYLRFIGFDLFVLLHAPRADASVLRRRLRALLADLPLSKDILVSDPKTYARARTQLNSVYRDIATEGVALWLDHHLNPSAIQRVCR
jgi:hypothetical protein